MINLVVWDAYKVNITTLGPVGKQALFYCPEINETKV